MRVTSRRCLGAYHYDHRNQEAAMLMKNWKLGFVGVAALAVTAALTFSTFANQRLAPHAAVQMPEMVIVTVPAANPVNASVLAGAEAIAYPSNMIQYGLAE